MNSKMLYETVKELCTTHGINVNHLEKELHFGTGTIGKWSQSSPSIEKVVAVAEFFGVSIDELCGVKKKKAESAVLQGIIHFTKENMLKWLPCPVSELLNRSFSPAIEAVKFEKVYFTVYKNGFLYLVRNAIEDGSEIELYIGVDDTPCMRQDEEDKLLETLWEEIKEKEQMQKEAVENYKQLFVL